MSASAVASQREIALDKTTEKFVSFASDLNYADLTAEAIHAVKRSVVDSIGCALGAFHARPVQAVRNLVSQVTAARPATVIGTTIRSSPELAAFASGSMIRYSDFSDDYFGGSGDYGPHPSDNIGGILAATEAVGADARDLILGIAIAYEACGKIVDHTALRGGGWDYSVLHAIATSLGAGKVLGLSREQLGNALALAIVPNICLYETRRGEITNWKGFAGPNASRNGLFAAMLAQAGITGPAEPFEGKAGFMNQLGNRFELGALGGKGTAFKVEGTFFKYLPVKYDVQLSIWVALELRRRVKIEDVESICVHVVRRFVVSRAEHPAYWDPQTRETADHSNPYLIGAALVDGEITPRTFTPERYRDPALLAVVRKIRMEEDKSYTAAFPRTFNCRFEATLKSGDRVTVHQTNPRGHPSNPMTDREIEEKFLRQTAGVLPETQSRALLDQLWNLEKVDDLQKLLHLMLVPERG